MKHVLFALVLSPVSVTAVAEDYDPRTDSNLQQRIEDHIYRPTFPPDIPRPPSCRAYELSGDSYHSFGSSKRDACRRALLRCKREAYRPKTCQIRW